ncbi:MAG: hypothetical protein DMF69_09615, partial [Acidobacteria bacterium]
DDNELADATPTSWDQNEIDLGGLLPGQIGGIVVDPNGAVIPGADVTIVNTQTGATVKTQSNSDGQWLIPNMQPGPVTVSVDRGGFRSLRQDVDLAAARPTRLGSTLQVGTVSETVTVTAGDNNNMSIDGLRKLESNARQTQGLYLNTPSQNVFNLQRRVAGVLPVRVDVPKAGKSYRFVRPLVVDEETNVSFEYRSK